MPYNQFGQWVDETGYSPMPGAGMPSVSSDGSTLGPGGWSSMLALQGIQQMRGGRQGQPQAPYDTVYTGHASERVPEDPRTLAMVPNLMQRFGPAGNGAPSWGRFGDTLRINGAEQSIPAGAGDAWVNQQVNAAATPGMDTMQRSQALLNYLYKQPGMDALTASQLHTRVLGLDPSALAGQQQKDTEHHMRIAMDLQNQRKALLDEATAIGKQFGGLPGDIHESFGMLGPGHENEYWNPGESLTPDPMTGEPRVTKAGARGIDPAAAARIAQIYQQLGMNVRDPVAARDHVAQLEAERQQLRAQAGPAEVQGPPDTRLGVRIHNAVIPGETLPQVESRAFGRAANVGAWGLNNLIDFGNFHRQIFGGASAPQAPNVPTPYRSTDAPYDWLLNFGHIPPFAR